MPPGGRLLALAAVLVAAVAGCSAPGPEPTDLATGRSAATATPTPRGGGAFYAFIRPLISLDPARALEADELLVVGQLFDSLTTVGAGSDVVPAAAESWEADADHTVFTFRLRAGATFHDGEPVTAASFKAAWERVLRAEGADRSPAYYLLEPVLGHAEAERGGALRGVVAADDLTLRVELTAPFADFPAAVSHPALAPVPPAASNPRSGFAQVPVGNGPFRMAEPWVPGQFVRLEAFAKHPGGAPLLDQLVFRIYEGDDAAAAGYKDFVDGRLDLAPVPEPSIDEAAERFGRSPDGYRGPGLLDGVQLITAYFGFNTRQPPFDDPTVRRALSLLVDRATITRQLGEKTPARSIVPPGVLPYEPPPCEFCDYDPQRAQALLGGRRVGPIDLYYYEDPEFQEVAERVARDVDDALGAGTVRLKPLPQAEWLEAVRRGDAGFFFSGWLADYPTADAFLHPLLHRSRIGTDNLTRYDSGTVSSLLDAARREADPAARAERYREAEAAALGDVPLAPLFYYRHAHVVSERASGFRLDPLGGIDMASVRVRPNR